MKRLFAILLLLLFLIPSSPQRVAVAAPSIDSIMGQAMMNAGLHSLSFKSLLSRGLLPSLAFSGSTDLVNCGSGATLDDLMTITYCVWFYSTDASADQHLLQKGRDGNSTGTRVFGYDGLTDNIYFGAHRTVGFSVNSDIDTIVHNQWWFAAGAVDLNAALGSQHLYIGDLNTSVAEVGTYLAGNTVGSGTFSSNASVDQILGNRDNGSVQMIGRIAFAAIWNRQLSAGEIQAQQFKPHVTSGCVGFWILGYNGTTSVPDWSGNGNNGATVTGATVGDHVPLKAPF